MTKSMEKKKRRKNKNNFLNNTSIDRGIVMSTNKISGKRTLRKNPPLRPITAPGPANLKFKKSYNENGGHVWE